jgi:DNA polymerase-3 subunit gamma/tau
MAAAPEDDAAAPALKPSTAPIVAAPDPPAAAPQPKPQAGLIDDQAKRLADFFNGEVVQLDGPLPELEDGNGGSQAA